MPGSKRILLTGGAGFVGSYAVRALVEAGHDVTCLLRSSTDLWRIADIQSLVTVARADLENTSATRAIFQSAKPQVVVHLAWGGVLGSSRNDPGQANNVGASIALMGSAIESGCSHFVGLGSQAEYGPCPDVVWEDMPTEPTTLYGVSKLATLMVLRKMAQEAQLRFTWMRLFSSYGPKDDPSWLLPFLILRLKRRELPELTKGEQMWDYIHVADTAQAIAAVVGSGAAGVFNLASGKAESLRSIIEMVRDYIDPNLPLEFGRLPYRPDQIMHLQGDITALTQATGWRPKIRLEDGILETVNYYLRQN